MPTCTCQAGVHGKMCWHVAKVLWLQGSSEHALLRHMGLFVGSKQGAYWQLKAATEREVHASSDARQQDAQQHSASNVSDAVQQPQRAQPAPAATQCASSQQGRHLHSTRRRHWKRWQYL